MKNINNHTKCLQYIRQGKWAKAEKIILFAPEILHLCVSGEDSVLIAALKNFCSDDFLQFLIASGSDVNSKDCNGNTPLYHACFNRTYECQRAEDSVNYQILFQAGARLTPFEELIIAGNAPHPDWKKMQQILCDDPEVVSVTDENGDTLLSRSACVEYCELFEFFLKSAKWDLNLVTSPESGSILGQIWESAYLVNSSDSPKKVKKRQYMKTELIPKLKSMGAEKLPEEELFEYIVTADISALQKMMQKNPDMINAMYHGETVFTAICDAVCRFGLTQYDDIIELFIRAGADVNASSQWGMNVLHWAMKFGNEELEKKFIALGANINTKDNKGNTPLHWAMGGCHYWPAELLEAGADVNAINNDGETPLDWVKDGWTPEHTRQFRKALKQMGALSGKELKRGGKMKKLLLTLFALGMLFLTGCFQLPAEYRFSAHNVGGGFIIFEPFDICGGTPFPLHPSTCQSFDADMSMPASRPHADTLSLKWRYWESVESYKKGDPGIACEQSVTLKPPCLNPEFYSIEFCFNQKEVFVVYRIIWNGWKDAESVLSDGCPFGYGEDLVGELSYFKKKPNSSYASFFKAMHKKYDYHPERRKNSNYFRLKWSSGKVVHYCKTDGTDIFWGDVENIDDKNSVQRRFMRYGFEEIILKIIAKPDITQEEFTSFVKDSGKENECFISDDLTAWKKITEIVVRKKMLDPDKRFVKKITIPELQNQIAIIGLTPGKTFTLTFENVLSDEIKVDSKLIDRLKNQGYFSQISRICKK